jgi:hypothetical protein
VLVYVYWVVVVPPSVYVLGFSVYVTGFSVYVFGPVCLQVVLVWIGLSSVCGVLCVCMCV